MYIVAGRLYFNSFSITGINLFFISSTAVESDFPPENASITSAFLFNRNVVGNPQRRLKLFCMISFPFGTCSNFHGFSVKKSFMS